MLSIKNILHATDFSAQSEDAFRLACALAADYSANLTILHVIKRPMILGEGVIFPSSESHQEEVEEMLNDLEVPDDRVDAVKRLEEGNPAIEILRLAQLVHADLIVMGTHRRRSLNRLLLGSVAERVVRNATCPVLTVAASQTPAAPSSPSRQKEEAVHT